MKHIFFLLTACLGLLAACSGLNEKDFEENTVLDDGGLVERVIFEAPVMRSLGDGDETRASLSQEGDGGIHFGWQATDIVGIYPNQGGQVYFSMADGVGTNVARFDGGGWALRKGYTYSCYYPLVSDMFLDRNAIPVSFANQVQTGVSTYEGVRFFLASEGTSSSDGTLHFTFKILNTVIRIKAIDLPAGTYTKLTLTTEDDLFIQDGTFGLEDMEITGKTYSNTLELLLNDFVLTEASTEANPVLFYLTSAPIDLTGKTIIIRAYSEDGSIYECEKTPGKAYEAGDWGGLKCNMIRIQPNNVINYSSTDGKVVTPSKADAFGANIVSNEYIGDLGIITFDGDVTRIGFEAFKGRNSLSGITIPESVSSIGFSAFHDCSNLENLTIPNSVSTIEDFAFCDTKLSSITIPESVTSIGIYAFSGTKVTSLIIPSSVTKLGVFAFDGCEELKKITFLNPTPIILDNRMFEDEVIEQCKIFVPATSVKDYKSSWYFCPDRIYALPEYVDLGLSVKWATFNIGASAPEEYGDYYAWGETEPYYRSLNPLYWKAGKSAGYAWESYQFNPSGDGITFLKYTGNDSDNLLREDDAATEIWGENWHIPSYDEWAALRNEDDFTWKWTDDYNGTGVAGRIVTSKIPGFIGNSIFLPAAGVRANTSLAFDGSQGWYWSSTHKGEFSYYSNSNAWGSYFSPRMIDDNTCDRYDGQPIRPVCQ